MKQKMMVTFGLLLCFTMCFTVMFSEKVHAQTVSSNSTGKHGGYDYEFWVDQGNGTMVLKDGGAFSCEWNNINNILFRKGLKYNETQTYQQIGNMTMTYACNYQPSGNSYLSVYGWTSDPLVEYYIIESWGTWKPPGNVQSKGTVTIDGGVYDIFETTRNQQPSIKGTATFQQYWSVRQEKRTSGTISISEHFKAWEAKGMKMGKFYEVSLVVEGYQSSGKADVTKMDIAIGGQSSGAIDNNWNQGMNQGANDWNQGWNQDMNQGANDWNQGWNQDMNQGANDWNQGWNQGANDWNQGWNQGANDWNQGMGW